MSYRKVFLSASSSSPSSSAGRDSAAGGCSPPSLGWRSLGQQLTWRSCIPARPLAPKRPQPKACPEFQIIPPSGPGAALITFHLHSTACGDSVRRVRPALTPRLRHAQADTWILAEIGKPQSDGPITLSLTAPCRRPDCGQPCRFK